jgi:hypothetical protein
MTPVRRRAFVGALASIAVLAAVAIVPPRAADAARRPGVDVLAQRGFGDPRNVYSWSMEWFKGKLYVGTARSEACVENITIDYYLRVSERYVTRPFPGVRCPRDPYDMDLRAELWEYAPREGRWRMVYRSPADIPNPRARGKFVARDIAFRGMTVHRGALYIGGVTADEYIPELKKKHPPRILSTTDGRHFRVTPARDVVVRMPYGDFRPIGFRAMRTWRGRLFVTATPGLTGDGAIFEIRRPWSRHARFKQVSPRTLAVFETEVFKGSLYAGTGDRLAGYGVWKTSSKGPRYRFRPVLRGGAGRGNTVTSVVAMKTFRDRLYVGSSGWYNEDEVPVSELVRIDHRGRWQVVTGETRLVNGRVKAPISGLRDGFANIFAAHFWRMVRYDGALYVGTNDWSWVVQTAYSAMEPWLAGLVQSALSGEFGFDLWASCDGRDWAPVTRDAFGDNMYDFGARNLVSTPSGLFVGSANHSQGTKVWRTRVSPCSSLVGKARDAVARHPTAPRRVLTDVQRAGTVVSWRRSRAATRYRVFRAAYRSVPLTLAPPPVMPNGFRLEDQVPVIVPPGTPGSKEVQIPTLQGFAAVGTTRASHFVDRTGRRGARYAYRVIAEGASGGASEPSTMQVVPDPRPAPTFEALAQTVGHRTVAGSIATAAGIAHMRRDRTATLRGLARLRRAVGRDADARDLVERLARRVRFGGVAGGG